MSYQNAELIKYHDMTSTVRQFVFCLNESGWEYEPGQHTVLRFEQDGETVNRPYTPVNLPGTDKFVLTVKEYDDGTASVWLHDLEIGDKAEFDEPHGNLSIRDYTEDIVLISTGTGATPMFAMLRDYLKKGEGNVKYIHGEKTREDLLFKESLEVLEAENDNLSVDFSLTRQDWDGYTGYVQENLEEMVDELGDKTFYLCGVPGMVVQTNEKLQDMGVDKSNIVTEGWESEAA